MRLARQPERDALDRPDVVRNVLADRSVAARGCELQGTVAVSQADGQTVELGFAGVLDLTLRLELLAHSPVESLHVFARERVLQREHRDAMAHLREAGDRGAADALR